MPLLKVEDLSLATHGGIILQPISFAINPAEIIALIGKSGSGKTSLALAMLGILSPGITLQHGKIIWSHEGAIFEFPDNRMDWSKLRGRHIGFIQQDVYGAFDPLLRMGKQMTMVVKEKSRVPQKEIESQLKNMLANVGLEEIERLWNSYPHQLSGGQLQRCQIAMVAVLKPQLLIADEPTSAIDQITKDELMQVFLKLRNDFKIAILCITHDPKVVNSIANKTIELTESITDHASGKPVMIDTPGIVLECDELLYQYSFGGLFSRKGNGIGPLSFKLASGTCLGIIGESGSGKSTLAQMLVGLLEPDSGSLTVEGRRIDYKKEKDIKFLREKIQLVFQDGRGALHPHLSVEELLGETDSFLRSDQDQQKESRILNLLTEVDLPHDVLDRKSSALSGGECLRVNIARALLLQPSLLICDESTSALDYETRDAILNLLRNLMVQHQMSVIMITHDDEVIRRMANQVIVIHAGKIAEQGPAESVIQNPDHPLSKKIFSGHATP